MCELDREKLREFREELDQDCDDTEEEDFDFTDYGAE